MKPGRAILLVEDNPADVKIMQRALAQTAIRVELVVVHDGQEALDYLMRQGAYSRREETDVNGGMEVTAWRHPDLVVLDLNLPRLTGIDVLRQVRTAEQLCLTPVVVLLPL